MVIWPLVVDAPTLTSQEASASPLAKEVSRRAVRAGVEMVGLVGFPLPSAYQVATFPKDEV